MVDNQSPHTQCEPNSAINIIHKKMEWDGYNWVWRVTCDLREIIREQAAARSLHNATV